MSSVTPAASGAGTAADLLMQSGVTIAAPDALEDMAVGLLPEFAQALTLALHDFKKTSEQFDFKDIDKPDVATPDIPISASIPGMVQPVTTPTVFPVPGLGGVTATPVSGDAAAVVTHRSMAAPQQRRAMFAAAPEPATGKMLPVPASGLPPMLIPDTGPGSADDAPGVSLLAGGVRHPEPPAMQRRSWSPLSDSQGIDESRTGTSNLRATASIPGQVQPATAPTVFPVPGLSDATATPADGGAMDARPGLAAPLQRRVMYAAAPEPATGRTLPVPGSGLSPMRTSDAGSDSADDAPGGSLLAGVARQSEPPGMQQRSWSPARAGASESPSGPDTRFGSASGLSAAARSGVLMGNTVADSHGAASRADVSAKVVTAAVAPPPVGAGSDYDPVPDGTIQAIGQEPLARASRATAQASAPAALAGDTPEAVLVPAASAHAPQPVGQGAAATGAAGGPREPVLPFAPLALGRDTQWATELDARVRWFAGRGMDVAQIRLDPPELGPLHVTVHSQREGTSVHFATASVQVRELLEQSLPRLRELLEGGGMNLLDVNVAQQHHGSGGQPQQSAGSRADASAVVRPESIESRIDRAGSAHRGIIDAYA